MIISKAPLRISLAGGGTDVKDFFKRDFGCVVNTTINKYIYIGIHKHFDGRSFLLKYSKNESGKDVKKIKHPLFREAMKLTGISGVEIVSMSDVPVRGVGLGSSSSFLVGILNALYAYKGEKKDPDVLARQAAFIEREVLKERGGLQDQYIAAFGGLRFMKFSPNNRITVKSLDCREEIKKELDKHLLMFYTGITRSSNDIHRAQSKNINTNFKNLLKLRGLAVRLKENLQKNKLDSIGEILHESWMLKKELTRNISSSQINSYYEKAIKAGASGGKLLGAGGGGFLLFYCEPEKQEDIRRALSKLEELKFQFEPRGSEIIFNHENNQA